MLLFVVVGASITPTDFARYVAVYVVRAGYGPRRITKTDQRLKALDMRAPALENHPTVKSRCPFRPEPLAFV